MSRGPGRWQNRILEAVDGGGWVALVDLLPEGTSTTDAGYRALHRAAHVLHEQGRISLEVVRRPWRWWVGVDGSTDNSRARIFVGPLEMPAKAGRPS